MHLFDFQSKLKKLNPNLYVKTDEAKKHTDEISVSGIYLKQHKRNAMRYSSDKNLVHAEHEKYLNALEAGELDTYICGVSLQHVPEYDIFDLARSQMLMPGWRKIALHLVKLKVCTLDQAKKVFNCSSLGESDYDKMKFFERLEWAKKLAKEVPGA